MYLRHSSADKGDSIAGQRALCREWLEHNGIEDAAEYSEDATSAYKKRMLDRPQWSELEAAIRTGQVTHVVARHIDRLTRSMTDLEHLVQLVEATGVRLSTVWSSDLDLNSPAGRQTARILASVAQGESETKSQRILASKERARAAGRASGGPRPFGYTSASGDLVDAEAVLVRQGLQDALDGLSAHSIARKWDASGVPSARGGQWHVKTVKGVLTRWRNAGQLEHKGEPVGEALYPAITDLETVQAVRAVLLDPSRVKGVFGADGGPKPTTLMSGLALCGACGSPMKARRMDDGKGARVGAYTCSARSCNLTIRRELLDSEVARAMTRFYMDADVSDLAPSDADRAEYVRLQGERGELETERAGIIAMMKSGSLRAAEAADVLGGIEDRHSAVEAVTEALSRRFALAASMAAPISETGRVDLDAATAIRTRFDAQHLDLRRRQVQQVWIVTVRSRHYASGYGLGEKFKQQARLKFDCLPRPAMSFDNLTELTTVEYD